MLLALDVATAVGFAYGGVSDGAPTCGTANLPPGIHNENRALGSIYQLVAGMCRTHKVEIVCVEAPLPYIKTDVEISFRLNRLEACARSAAQNNGARIIQGNVQTVRKYFVGSGTPPDPKAVVMARCRQLNWKPDSLDAADACALWAWGMANNFPRWSISQTPLFAQR